MMMDVSVCTDKSGLTAIKEVLCLGGVEDTHANTHTHAHTHTHTRTHTHWLSKMGNIIIALEGQSRERSILVGMSWSLDERNGPG